MKNAGAVIRAVALLCAASGACAQGYPPKPIRIVVGFPAGGGNDIIARRVGAMMQENTHQVPGSCEAPATRTRHSGRESMPFFYKPVIYLASPTGFEPVLPP